MALTIPFNFQPVEVFEDPSSHTVTSGRYALVTVSMSVAARARFSGSALSDGGVTLSNGCNSTSLQFWVLSGQSLTKSESAASDTASPSASVADVHGRSTATFSIDGTVVAEINTDASGAVEGTGTLTVDGESHVQMFIQEFSSIT